MMRRGRKIYIYSLGGLGLSILVAVAFLLPGFVFAAQDERLCKGMVSVTREELDVASFNTDYEANLYRRLLRFAQGLKEEKQYYVAEQDMLLSEEAESFLHSDQGFYQNSMMALTETRLLPSEILEYVPVVWKQYVIYGDDYKEGVNFILWYFELTDDAEEETARIKLLMDGRTGDFYGIRTDFSGLIDRLVTLKGLYRSETDSLEAYLNITGERDMQQVCFWLMRGFCGYQDMKELSLLLQDDEYEFWQVCHDFIIEKVYYENKIQISPDKTVAKKENEEVTGDGNEAGTDALREAEQALRELIGRVEWSSLDSGKQMKFRFPYGECELNFKITLMGDAVKFYQNILGKYTEQARYCDMLAGFEEIYELIPGFAE